MRINNFLKLPEADKFKKGTIEAVRNNLLATKSFIHDVFFETLGCTGLTYLGLFMGFNKADTRFAVIVFLILSFLSITGSFILNSRPKIRVIVTAGLVYTVTYLWGLDHYKYFVLDQ